MLIVAVDDGVIIIRVVCGLRKGRTQNWNDPSDEVIFVIGHTNEGIKQAIGRHWDIVIMVSGQKADARTVLKFDGFYFASEGLCPTEKAREGQKVVRA